MLDPTTPARWLQFPLTPSAFRERTLHWLREAIPFDGGIFHARAPRVPMATDAFVGSAPHRLAPHTWDGLAGQLGRLRGTAQAHAHVTSDTEALPSAGTIRAAYYDAMRPLGVHHLALMHLVVADQIRAVVLLGRTRPDPFQPHELDTLRRLAPVLAASDTVSQLMAGTPQAARRGTTCVDDRLTARQREMVSLVAEGLTNRDIAVALGLSPNTVRNRLADAFRRVQVASRAELISRASFR